MITYTHGSQWHRLKWALVLPLMIAVQPMELAAGNILVQVTNQSGNVYQYQFSPTGMTFSQNQEFDVRFDPGLFGSIFSGVADSDFRLSLLQPNNPVGAFGDYSALALVDNPSLAGPFSVDVTWLGQGVPLATLPFEIHQFDASGRIVATLDSGLVGAPEPAEWLLSGGALLLSGLLRSARRRR